MTHLGEREELVRGGRIGAMRRMTIQQALELAMEHHRAGRLQEAATVYQQILGVNPDFVPALQLLGELLAKVGRFADAEPLLRRALALEPTLPVQNTLGHALVSLGKLQDAIDVFETVTRLRNDDFVAWSNLGAVYQMMARPGDAVRAQLRAVALNANDVGTRCNLALALRAAGKFEEATAHARKAVELEAGSADARQVLGNLLTAQGALAEGEEHLREAVRLQPGDPVNHSNLGIALQHDGRLEAAVAAFEEAIRFGPTSAEAHNNLAATLRELGEVEQALEHYGKAVALKPDYLVADSAVLLTLHYREIDAAPLLEAHRAWEDRQTKPMKALRREHSNSRDVRKRLRVGYLSPDFREHPIASFIEPLLAAHDRERVEVICYSDVTRPDDVTRRLRECADQWRETAVLRDEELVERVRDDRIDVLVDLALHTGGSRLRAMAARPAPVQCSYLGYCSTSGLSYIDYRLTDAQVDPEGAAEQWYTEKLARLPGGFCCYLPPENAPEPAQRKQKEVRFGSFNNLAKATDEMLSAWCEILRRVPGSTLLIQARGADEEIVRERVQKAASVHEVGMERIELRGAQKLTDYLQTLSEVDVVLDTYPFNGHTTSCHAMWMGAPMVSRCGAMPVSRVGLSLLSMLGLEKLVAKSVDEYVGKAVELAAPGAARQELRSSIRDRMRSSRLMNAEALAREVEAAYSGMWREWCLSR